MTNSQSKETKKIKVVKFSNKYLDKLYKYYANKRKSVSTGFNQS